jgi:hypothetical protein
MYGDALVLGVFEAAIEGRTDAAREIREAIEGSHGSVWSSVLPRTARR